MKNIFNFNSSFPVALFLARHTKTITLGAALFVLSSLSVLNSAWAQTEKPPLSPPASDAPQVDGAIIKAPPRVPPATDKNMVITPELPKTSEDMIIEPSTNPALKKQMPGSIPGSPPRQNMPAKPINPTLPDNRASNNGDNSAAVSSPVMPPQATGVIPIFPKGLEQQEVDNIMREKKIIGQIYSPNCTNASNYICRDKIAALFPEQKIAIRVVGDNDAMTMDYSPSRLTIHIDENQKIKSIKVG